jgi:flagellar protein FliO/FliZ
MDIFGAEGSLIVRFVVAFVIVLALIGATFWLIRRFGGTRVGAAAQRGRQPRLAVIDAAPVDGRRRLVLVRRDNVEHLLMIGGPSDIVVEQNIVRAVPVTPPRDVPVPRTGAPEGSPVRTIADRAPPPEDEWTPPEPAPRPAFTRPEPLGRESLAREPLGREPLARPRLPEPRSPEPRPYDPPMRPPLPASIAPLAARPFEPAPIAPEPATEPQDAALANMAQRLEAALRRPAEPRPAAPPVPAPDLAFDAPPAAPENGEPPAEAKPPAPSTGAPAAKSKSVLDSLEEEMASLLGRPPEKQ